MKKGGKRAVLVHGQVVSEMPKCPALQCTSGHPQQVMAKGAVASGKKMDILANGFISSIASAASLVFHPEGYVERKKVWER